MMKRSNRWHLFWFNLSISMLFAHRYRHHIRLNVSISILNLVRHQIDCDVATNSRFKFKWRFQAFQWKFFTSRTFEIPFAHLSTEFNVRLHWFISNVIQFICSHQKYTRKYLRRPKWRHVCIWCALILSKSSTTNFFVTRRSISHFGKLFHLCTLSL